MSAFFTFAGNIGDYIDTPDTPDLDIQNPDMEVDVDIPALTTTVEIFNKYENNEKTYGMFWTTTLPGFRWSTDGLDDKSRVGNAVVATGRHVIRVLGDMVGSSLISYFWDEVPAGTSGATDTIFSSIASLQVGSRLLGGQGMFTGDCYRATLRAGAGGTILAEMDPSTAPFVNGPVPNGSNWVSSDGRTWTVHGTGVSITHAPANAPDLFVFRAERGANRTLYNQDLVLIRPQT
jgi:hypothetical protein